MRWFVLLPGNAGDLLERDEEPAIGTSVQQHTHSWQIELLVD
jgi:hypothetical protein